SDSVETALRLGGGMLTVYFPDTEAEELYSEHFVCLEDGINIPELAPRNFSFNSPHGACPACTGLGTRLVVDPNLIMPNTRLSLAEGAIRPWSRTTSRMTWYTKLLDAVADQYGFSTRIPVFELTKEQLEIVLYGTKDETIIVRSGGALRTREFKTTFEGVIPNLERRYRETDSEY